MIRSFRGASSTCDTSILVRNEERMRESNVIEATSDQEISRLIRYLDPDVREFKAGARHNSDFEGLIMLVLLLGGVLVCFAVLLIHTAE